MNVRLRFAMGLATVLFAGLLVAQSPSGKKPVKAPPQAGDDKSRSDDLAAIRQAAVDFEADFNAGQAQAVAAHWTEDGDYISETGQVFSGRPAIEKQYAEFFAANEGVRLRVVIDSLRLLSDTTAIEDGRASLEPTPAGAPAYSRYTAVHVNVDGAWRMSTVRDTRIETPSAYRRVADLEWLIGTWIAEEHGAKTESVCRWVANKSFVQRTYTITHPDQTTTSGLQIIGFNPQGDRIQSWNFSSDGGIAAGTWSPRENGWSAEMHGTLADGQSTSSTNLLTRLDDNAYTWQSVQRTAGGELLPDTDEVVLKRQVK